VDDAIGSANLKASNGHEHDDEDLNTPLLLLVRACLVDSHRLSRHTLSKPKFVVNIFCHHIFGNSHTLPKVRFDQMWISTKHALDVCFRSNHVIQVPNMRGTLL